MKILTSKSTIFILVHLFSTLASFKFLAFDHQLFIDTFELDPQNEFSLPPNDDDETCLDPSSRDLDHIYTSLLIEEGLDLATPIDHAKQAQIKG